MATTQQVAGTRPRRRFNTEALVMVAGVVAMVVALVLFLVLPLYALLSKSFKADDGSFVGLANYLEYFSSTGLTQSINNSLTIAVLTMVIACVLAFIYAYALTRSCMPFKRVFRAIATIPILAPSLLPAISLVYLFGNQGMIKGLLFGESIYGPIGIMIGMVFYIFPHVMMIMVTALSTTDASASTRRRTRSAPGRLQRLLSPSPCPGAIYGIDLRGGRRLHPHHHRFRRAQGDRRAVQRTRHRYLQAGGGAAEFLHGRGRRAWCLLLPAMLPPSLIDRHGCKRKQVALLSARAVPYHPKPHQLTRRYAACPGLLHPGIGVSWSVYLGYRGLRVVCIKFWPYDLSFSLVHYDFDAVDPERLVVVLRTASVMAASHRGHRRRW